MGRVSELIESVESLFETVEKDMVAFRSRTGLSCLKGCSACCDYPQIEATILEFLPLALHLVEAGKAEAVLESLADGGGGCPFHKPGVGCSVYPKRGLVCRLFGFGAVRDRSGRAVFAPCRRMKARIPETIQAIQFQIDDGLSVPKMADYGFQLALMDPFLGATFYPLRQAMAKAIERTLLDVQMECAARDTESLIGAHASRALPGVKHAGSHILGPQGGRRKAALPGSAAPAPCHGMGGR